jgi:hypothetical protein
MCFTHNSEAFVKRGLKELCGIVRAGERLKKIIVETIFAKIS